MKKTFLLIIIALFYCNCFAATQWQTLAPGLSYTQIYATPGFPLGAIHAFKINLADYHLQLAFTNTLNHPLVVVKDLVMYNNAVIGINGGFFSPEIQPLGLRIKDGQQISPIKHISWWGIFYIKNNRPYIIPQSQYQSSKHISFAVESGPRLVVDGQIPALKAGWSFRSALGITPKGEVIIAVTDRVPITTKMFATILRKPEAKGGLNCVNALNLDGGSSSQLYAQLGVFYLNIPSLAPISDAILVLPNS